MNGERAGWDELHRAARELARTVEPGNAYIVDPTAGLAAFPALIAVATTPDTVLLWAHATSTGLPLEPVASGLYAVPWRGPQIERPLWGILTSGTSGAPKIPLGYADTLELVVLQYEKALFEPTFGADAPVTTFATCLPLQFSAAFFMSVLPAMVLRRDLLVFPPHDWRALADIGRRERVICQAVPSITGAGAMSLPGPTDLSRVAVFMGAGYVTEERVRTIRRRFTGVSLANIYGTAETGAICLDRDPGRHAHVGRPIAGKPVWLTEPDADGIGVVATTGPDCRRFSWASDGPPVATGDVVASTDYGHFDQDGHLYLDGRVDGGEKLHGITIYPGRIERHILELPGVVDARVTICHSADGPDHLRAAVIGQITADQVRECCSVRPPAERPAVIECIPEEAAARAYTAHGKLTSA